MSTLPKQAVTVSAPEERIIHVGENNDTRGAAFFDLDRTLIRENTAILYARHERSHGRITAFQMAQSGFWMLLYHFSLLDLDAVYKRAVEFHTGHSAVELEQRTHDWFLDEVAHRLLPGARAAIDEHRDKVRPTVILTNSSCYQADIAAQTWGLDDWIANSFPTDEEGRLTGDYVHPLCYGKGKVTRATRWLDTREMNLDASYFYTDSLSDLPMLDAVGHPRVVNPDPRLRRVARRRGWPILDWAGGK